MRGGERSMGTAPPCGGRGGGGRGLLEGEGTLGANSEQLQSGWGALKNRLGAGRSFGTEFFFSNFVKDRP